MLRGGRGQAGAPKTRAFCSPKKQQSQPMSSETIAEAQVAVSCKGGMVDDIIARARNRAARDAALWRMRWGASICPKRPEGAPSAHPSPPILKLPWAILKQFWDRLEAVLGLQNIRVFRGPSLAATATQHRQVGRLQPSSGSWLSRGPLPT